MAVRLDLPARFLDLLFEAAVGAADPLTHVPLHLPRPPQGRTIVVGAGKAAAAMAKAVEDHFPEPVSGLVLTRYGHGLATRSIEVIEAGHPMPDEAGLAGARRILALARALRPADLLLCLFSGGGSALLTLPADGLSLADKREVNGALLRSGAPIAEINCVRKHLSAIKGGRLAAATRSTIRTLAISDVPGDDPQVIASGPTVADPTTLAQALEVLTAYGITPPDAVLVHLLNPANETPKPGDPCFSRAETKVIATPAEALAAAARIAADHGVRALILGDAIQGEAQEVARAHARLALETAEGQGPVPPPCVLISGGETTVTVRGRGRGGRNAEYLLALALALEGHPRIHALAADTDGIDGTETNAGAVIAPDTLERARRLGLDPAARLADNDAFTIFAALSDLLVTGPTRTNVNDFRAILVLDPASDSIPSGQAGTALTKIRGQG